MRALPVATMRAYVPGFLRATILAGDAQWIIEQSEQRMVTLLIMRMWPPRNTPVLSQVAAYSTAVSTSQNVLIKKRTFLKS